MKKRGKKAAMELSIGTIVILVIGMSMLILGLIFVRKIMCSGIIITEQISTSVENEIKGLFNVDDYGVRCLGEEGEEVKIGDGGRRQIPCVIKTDETMEYELKIKSIESIKGVSTNAVQNWILDKDWKGSVSTGDKTVPVVILDVPKNVDATTLKLTIEEITANGQQTHISYIDVVHVSGLTSAVC
jgi:hypothetical protein